MIHLIAVLVDRVLLELSKIRAERTAAARRARRAPMP